MRRLLEAMPEDTDWLGVDAIDRYYELLYSQKSIEKEMEYRQDSSGHLFQPGRPADRKRERHEGRSRGRQESANVHHAPGF